MRIVDERIVSHHPSREHHDLFVRVLSLYLSLTNAVQLFFFSRFLSRRHRNLFSLAVSLSVGVAFGGERVFLYGVHSRLYPYPMFYHPD